MPSDAGAGGKLHPAGGSGNIAGADATQAGSPSGGTGGGGASTGAGGANTGAGTGGGGTGGMGDNPNKVVLFDGSPESFRNWYPRNKGMMAPNPWTNNEDGTMTVHYGSGDILSTMPFTNVFLHVEYFSQEFPSSSLDAQQRGNSGVFLQGSYEMTIIDTFELMPTNQTCGAIYTVSAPLVSACRMGGQWNAYDIEFRANVCTNGTKTTNAKFVEVRLNGVLVQQDVDVPISTQAGLTEICSPRGVMLQDHSTVVPVSFRNIWAIPRD